MTEFNPSSLNDLRELNRRVEFLERLLAKAVTDRIPPEVMADAISGMDKGLK